MDKEKDHKLLATICTILAESDSELSSNTEDYLSESSSDGELFGAAVMVAVTNGPRRTNLSVANRLLHINSDAFRQHFRLWPSTFDELLRVVGPRFLSNRQIPPKTALLITIWFMATPDSFRSVAAQFGVGKGTAFRCVRKVTATLYDLSPGIIKWPVGAKADEVKEGFRKIKGISGVVGAIDGTHIHIRKPAGGDNSYINRKGVNSIQMQAICDHKKMFTHCFVGFPGSVHDARVFRCSPVFKYLNNEHYFPNNSHLIGDSAYPIHKNLIVPFKDYGHINNNQKHFNRCLSSTRITIEHAFGLWKTRFRVMLDCLPLTDLNFIPKFVVATCVLHNYCIIKNDVFDVISVPSSRNEATINFPTALRNIGEQKRFQLMHELSHI